MTPRHLFEEFFKFSLYLLFFFFVIILCVVAGAMGGFDSASKGGLESGVRIHLRTLNLWFLLRPFSPYSF